MAAKTASAEKPREEESTTVEIDLAGMTVARIAGMVTGGEITQEYAEAFVSQRAIRKLHKELGG